MKKTKQNRTEPNTPTRDSLRAGLFDEHRVRNVTCVFYPKTSNGGALAAYPAVHRPGAPGHSGPPLVIPCEKGTVVCLDTDSHNHHSEQALPVGWKGARTNARATADHGTPHPCPQLPAKAGCVLSLPLILSPSPLSFLSPTPRRATRPHLVCKRNGSQEKNRKYTFGVNTSAGEPGCAVILGDGRVHFHSARRVSLSDE